MVIAQTDLRIASQRGAAGKPQVPGQKVAFLCHSHKDALALGLQTLLREQGLSIYIDWQDGTMPEPPSKETADRLKRRIRASDLFLFLATVNSLASRWHPRELGHTDGVKSYDQIAVVPTNDGAQTHGNEYVELYRRIEPAGGGFPVVGCAPGNEYGKQRAQPLRP